MAKVTYAPSEEDIAEHALPKDTQQFGYDFTGGKAVEVTNPAHLRKFAGNPHFKVSGPVPTDNSTVRTAAERESAMLGQGSKDAVTRGPVVGPTISPVASQAETPANVSPGQADKPDGDSDIRAVHRGRGSYVVVQDGEDLVQGLSKEEAEDFNNLSAKEKLAYIAAQK